MSFIIEGHFLEARRIYFVKVSKLYIPKACKMRVLLIVGSMRGFHIYYIHKRGLCYLGFLI